MACCPGQLKAENPMSKKIYLITANISITPASGEDSLGQGDEIRLTPEDAKPLLDAGYIAVPAAKPAKAKPEPETGDELPATLKPVEGRDEVLPLPGRDTTVTVAQLLAEAYAASGMNVKAWNAQNDQEIKARLDAALAALAASAAA